MLQTIDLEIRSNNLPVVQGVSLEVPEGRLVTVLGANGSGKSSLLRGIVGGQKVQRGKVIFQGREIQGLPTARIVRMGLVYVPEQKMLFGPLSVIDNLRLGAYLIKDERVIQENLDRVFGLFPRLKERAMQSAQTLSGGEQQMVAIGRGLMSNPRLLMLDEPSLGLAPVLVTELLGTVARLKEAGMTILLVEQNVQEALRLSDYGYVLQAGRLVMEGEPTVLMGSPMVRTAYLGL
jgi:branched-chain amino acid transport system ATP-binding protein